MTAAADTPNVALARRAIELAGARDKDGLRAILDDEVVVEWPYGGRETLVYRGIDGALKSFAMADYFVTFTLDADAVYEAPGSDAVIVEAHSRGTIADGRRDYQNRYIFVFRMKDGRIVHWREYFNPIEGGRVFGKVS